MTLRIKELRKQRGLSLKQLAELTGIPKSSLGDIENHVMLASMERLEKIAQAFDVSVEDLFKK